MADTIKDPMATAFEQARATGEAMIATPDGSTYKANQSTVTLPTPPTPNIPIADVKPATPLNIPKPNYDLSSADGLVSGVKTGQKSLQDYITQLTPPETALQTEQKEIIDRVKQLLPETLGKNQALLTEEQNNKVPQLKQQLSELNSQILTRNAEYEKLNVDLEGKPIPLTFITGQQAQVRRQQASEIGLLQARALGLQGQVQAAQETAKRAVDLMYADKEEEINVRMRQLEALKPLLDKEEKKQAEAQALMLEDRKQALADEKEQQKQIQNIMIEAAKFGADSATLSRIQNSRSVQEAIVNGGSALGAEFKQKILQQQFENNLALDQLDLQKQELQVKRDEANAKLGGGINQQLAQDPVNTEYYSALGNAAIGFPENQRNELTARLNNYLANGDYSSAKQLIFSTVIGNMGSGQQDDAIKRLQAVDSLTTVKQLLNDAVAKTGDTGLLRGTTQDIVNKLGKTGDPELVQIGTRITQALQIYRNAITGAAWGEQETGEYKKLFPSYKNENKLNQGIIDGMLQALNDNQKISFGAKIGQETYDKIFGTKSANTEIQTKINQAKNQGYDSGSIIDYLKNDLNLKDKIDKARNMNYSDDEIIEYLGGADKTSLKVPEVSSVLPTAAKFSNGSLGGQCAAFTEKIVDLGTPNNTMGNLLEDKQKTVDKYGVSAKQLRANPKIGDVIVFNIGRYGHAAVINAILPNGQVRLTESNFNKDERVNHTRTISLNDPSIYGAFKGKIKGLPQI
jgi:surface antigen